MPDSDISHAVEARLSAIEDRLDALDGGPPEEVPPEEVPPEEETPEVTPYASRSRSRKTDTTEGTE